MADAVVSEAIRLYKGAGRLFKETKQLSKYAVRELRAEKKYELNEERHKVWIETAAGNADEMRRLLEKVIELGEESETLRRHRVYALAHRNLGLFFSRRFKSAAGPFPSNLEAAAEHLNAALSLGVRKDKKVCRTLGAAYYQSGRFREAAELLQESIAFDERDEVVRYHLCLTYLALHEQDKAREEYERLKLNPSSALYHLALMLEPVLQRPPKPVDEAEQAELHRFIKNCRRIKE